MKLLLCDDHAVFRSGLMGTLGGNRTDFVEASTADEAISQLTSDDDVDAVLLDRSMPGGEPWDSLTRLRAEHPSIPVIIVSGSEDPDTVRTAVDLGAAGFIAKSFPPQVYRAALDLVLQGGIYLPPQILAAAAVNGGSVAAPSKPRGRRRDGASKLTVRQRDVAELLVQGLTNAETASVLGIAEGTFKTHMSAIFDALDVTNRTEAVLAIQEAFAGR